MRVDEARDDRVCDSSYFSDLRSFECGGSRARSLASAAARFAGRGPFLILGRCEVNAQGTESGQSERRILVARRDHYACRQMVAEAAWLFLRSLVRPATTKRTRCFATNRGCLHSCFVQLCGRPNVITLSCKSRPPRRPPSGGAAAAATNMQWREPNAADVTPACSSEPPEGGSAAEPGLGGFCQLVRAVRRLAIETYVVPNERS